jgi:uncharacterized membrane protein
MRSLLASPRNAAVAGTAIATVVLIVFVAVSNVDRAGLTSALLRIVHVLGGMIWIGMIWFVNFSQLAAVRDADQAGRGALLRLVVPNVTRTFLHASSVTVLSGALLLVSTGYVLDRIVYGSAVYVATPNAIMLWAGVVAGVAMLGIAHGVLRPALAIVLGEKPADAEAVERARSRIALFARINLVLAIPVTVVMVLAAHL